MYVKKFKRLFIPIYQCCFQCQLHYNLLTYLLYFSVQSFAIFMFHYKQYFKYLYDKMKSYKIKQLVLYPVGDGSLMYVDALKGQVGTPEVYNKYLYTYILIQILGTPVWAECRLEITLNSAAKFFKELQEIADKDAAGKA